MDYIRSIITHPAIFPSAIDEGSPDAWMPNLGPLMVWLRAPGAIFLAHPHSPVMWECHGAVLPEFRKHTRSYYREAFAWMRSNTACRYLIGMVAEGNRLARVAARAAGMSHIGFMPNSRMRQGQLVGTHIYGIEV